MILDNKAAMAVVAMAIAKLPDVASTCNRLRTPILAVELERNETE
jgi:hypothetical protein